LDKSEWFSSATYKILVEAPSTILAYQLLYRFNNLPSLFPFLTTGRGKGKGGTSEGTLTLTLPCPVKLFNSSFLHTTLL